MEQIRADPRTVSAIHVADRLNEKYTAEEGLRYLAATGGVFHREVPGVPVLANTPDWELTCGMPDQRSCDNNDPRFASETNVTLDRFHDSGHLDGLSISNNLKNFDAAAQPPPGSGRGAMARPVPPLEHVLQLSFGAAARDGTPDPVRATDATCGRLWRKVRKVSRSGHGTSCTTARSTRFSTRTDPRTRFGSGWPPSPNSCSDGGPPESLGRPAPYWSAQ